MNKPRVGFLGVGWIGRHRMEKMLETDVIEAVAIADPSEEMASAAAALAPQAAIVGSLDEILGLGVDGVVIATPSAVHAEQSIRALQAGAAVFCQKPLGRNAAETKTTVEAARAADRLLSVDLSYRETDGMRRIKQAVQTGTLGQLFAADFTFHNAYGPGKSWFFDKALSGGGCVIDLGVHLVDLALWLLDFPEVRDVKSCLFARGAPLSPDSDTVEDYAVVTMTLDRGVAVRVACSWNLHAGLPAEIGARLYGTEGGATLRNVDGSFFDFAAELNRGTQKEILCLPPDDWGGRAAQGWARALAAGDRFDPAATQLVHVAGILDRIYAGG
jgi:predicted dehydrogenase